MTAEYSPAINSLDYVYDRVQRIEVFFEIPSENHKSDTVKHLNLRAREAAFRKLLHHVEIGRVLTVECISRRKQEVADDGALRYFVGCELRYIAKR